MAALPAIAAIASIGAAVVGTGLAVAGYVQSADAANKAGAAEQQNQYFLAQQEQAAGQEDFAATQRDAQERRLEGELIMSRQQAVAAASGGGAGVDAPTIVRLMTETGSRTQYGIDSTLYAGASRRAGAFRSAAARRQSGDNSFLGGIQSAQGSYLAAAGSLASGIGQVGNLYDRRYGKVA